MNPYVSVIIPHRNENPAHLAATIASARAQLPAVEVLALEDSPAIGVSYRRHEGITSARSNVVIISDAHCVFDPGLFAGAVAMLEAHPARVLCFDCRDALPDTLAIMRDGAHRSGADWWPWHDGAMLDVKWRYVKQSGPTPCLMGGVYAFRRDFYLEAIGGIWQHSRGWGACEQLLSLATRKAGGEVWCMAEHEHSHLFKPGRSSTAEPMNPLHHKQNLWLAAYTLLTPEERAQIWAGKGIQNPAPTYGRIELDARGAIAAVEAHFAGLSLPWVPQIRFTSGPSLNGTAPDNRIRPDDSARPEKGTGRRRGRAKRTPV